MRVCVIFNPAARGEKAKILEEQLKQIPDLCDLKRTSGPGTARALAGQSVAEGYDTVVAAGGDGTVNEVLNGIGDATDGKARTRLGVLPFGTVNVFAREMGIPLQFNAAMRTILNGREALIDLPEMQFDSNGKTEKRYWVQMAGAGWDARAVELVNWELKKRIGQFAYVVSGLKALKRPIPLIQVCLESRTLQAELVILGNGRFYGGTIPVFRKANSRDGLLDVCVFPKITWFVLIRYCLGFLSSKLFSPGSETYIQTPTAKFESKERTPVELDGETVGCLPAACCVLPRTLRVIVP